MNFGEIEIYDGQTFDQLMKEIHHNSKNKSKKIDDLIDGLSGLVKSANDATLLVPLISSYIDSSIKNDDQLVKLAGVIQRMIKAPSSGGEQSETAFLTDEEREDLLRQPETSIVPLDGSKQQVIIKEEG